MYRFFVDLFYGNKFSSQKSYKCKRFELIIFECAQTEVYPHVDVWLGHCFVSKSNWFHNNLSLCCVDEHIYIVEMFTEC